MFTSTRIDVGKGDGSLVFMVLFMKKVKLGMVEGAMNNIEESLLPYEKKKELPDHGQGIGAVLHLHA